MLRIRIGSRFNWVSGSWFPILILIQAGQSCPPSKEMKKLWWNDFKQLGGPKPELENILYSDPRWIFFCFFFEPLCPCSASKLALTWPPKIFTNNFDIDVNKMKKLRILCWFRIRKKNCKKVPTQEVKV